MTKTSAYDTPLWRRLAAIAFNDPDAALSFTNRLARENRWTRDYAKRVAEEYRRFAYLAVTTGREITPSDEVDQAWHLHLVYTRHYWGPFCDALGAPLHHGPTAGGKAEAHRYRDNYAATLASYETAFGEKPPTDIWPPEDIRFGSAPHMARLNLMENIVLPRKAVWRAGSLVSAAAGVGAFAVAATAAAADDRARAVWEQVKTLPVFVWVGGGMFLCILAILLARGTASKGKSSGGCSGGAGAGCGGGKSADGGDGGSGCGGGGCGGGCGS